MASGDDILAELQRLVRTVEAIGPVVLELDEGDDHGDDLEVDDGLSDGPLVRLVNSLIFQAAEESASDVHFEAQEDAARGPAHPKKMAAG